LDFPIEFSISLLPLGGEGRMRGVNQILPRFTRYILFPLTLILSPSGGEEKNKIRGCVTIINQSIIENT
jgi:hypothetical protein